MYKRQAENDETLMEKFFESESLTEDEMREGIRKGCLLYTSIGT